jgi:thiol:disulfide interchange protein DsbD
MGYNLCYESGMCNPPEEAEKTLNLPCWPLTLRLRKPWLKLQRLRRLRNSSLQVASPPESQEADSPVVPESAAPPWSQILKYIIFCLSGRSYSEHHALCAAILPIRIMSIMNQAQKDRSKVLNHTFVYTLGVLVSFAILAGIFIALQQAGESAGWGLQNQNPGFVIVLMSIVFVFALSLLGISRFMLLAWEQPHKHQ